MGGFLSTVSQTIGHEFDPFNINIKAGWFKVKPLAPFFFCFDVKRRSRISLPLYLC